MPQYKCFNCLRTFTFDRPATSNRCPGCDVRKLRADDSVTLRRARTPPSAPNASPPPSSPKAPKPSRSKPLPQKRKRETPSEVKAPSAKPPPKSKGSSESPQKRRRITIPFDSVKSLGKLPPAWWTASTGPLGLVTWNVAHLGKLQPLVVKHFREACWWYQKDEKLGLGEFLVNELTTLLNLEEKTAEDFVNLLLHWLPPLKGPRPKDIEATLREKLGSLMDKKKNLIHRLLVLQSSVELFSLNGWLHMLVLQEVNLGIEHLQEVAKAAQLDIHLGPKLQSQGKKGASAEDEDGGREEGAKGGVQYEYYPLLLRRDSGLQYKTWYAISTDGQKYNGSDPYLWNKHQKNYRPVVVHVLQAGNTKIHVGVIHTTPGAGPSEYEFSREEEYKQILESLKRAQQESDAGSWWILCGDFYLTREAQVSDAQSLTAEQLRWGLVRNVPLSQQGEERQRLESLNHSALLRKHKTAVAKEREKLTQSLKTFKTKVTQGDLLRNLFTSFERQLPSKLAIAQTVHGTNWHGKALAGSIPSEEEARAKFFATARIADFFIYSREHLTCSAVGLVRPEGGLALSDSEDLEISRFWHRVSDHFPAGCLLVRQGSEKGKELQVKRALAHQEAPDELWEEFESRRLLHKTMVELLDLEGKNEKKRLLWLKGKNDNALESYMQGHDQEGLVFKASRKAQSALKESGSTSRLDFFPSQKSSRPSLFTPVTSPSVSSSSPSEDEDME